MVRAELSAYEDSDDPEISFQCPVRTRMIEIRNQPSELTQNRFESLYSSAVVNTEVGQ